MGYDFDSATDRQGTNSLKYDFIKEWGLPEGILPMWVADMDFPAPPEVLEDLQKAVGHGIFGYSEPKDDYYAAVSSWFASRYGYHVTAGETVTAPGVVFALAQALRAFSAPDDAVLIQTPVYFPFYDIIRENGRTLVANPLIYADGKYTIDFTDFEEKIAANSVRLFLLCNPHNPVGRVWTYNELARMNEICQRHRVLVLADEIHCDFVWPGHTHTCFGTLDENAVIATAPSKTFNLAGLQVSNIFVKNESLREKLKAEISRSGYSQIGTMGLISCQSAYAKGGLWLEELKRYLAGNIEFARQFLTDRLPRIKLVEPEGTYLLWLDFSAYGLSQSELDRRVTEGARLWFNTGTKFGADGTGFQRVNIACSRSVVSEALKRLEREFQMV